MLFFSMRTGTGLETRMKLLPSSPLMHLLITLFTDKKPRCAQEGKKIVGLFRHLLICLTPAKWFIHETEMAIQFLSSMATSTVMYSKSKSYVQKNMISKSKNVAPENTTLT